MHTSGNILQWLYGVLRTLIKAQRKQLKVDRRITFWDLFGTDDILDSEYLKEKMIAENLRKISLTHLFSRSFDQDNLVSIAQQALSTKLPDTTPHKSRDKDSLDELLNEAA